MCDLPLRSRLTSPKRWLEAVGTWIRKLHQYHIREILDKMVEMLNSSFKPNGPEAACLIFKKLNKQSGERSRSLANSGFYGPIAKKWLFYLVELRHGDTRGILENVRMQIIELEKGAPEELGNGVRNPGRLCGWLSGKTIFGWGKRGLSDYELTKSFRRSRILRTYPFKGEIWRRATSVGNTKRLGIGEPYRDVREEPQVYLRTIDRQLQNELIEQSRWGDADTYGHTRKPRKRAKNNDKGKEMILEEHCDMDEIITDV